MWNSSHNRRSAAAFMRAVSVSRAAFNLEAEGCRDAERRAPLLVALDCARQRLDVPLHVACDLWGLPRLDPHAMTTDRLAELVALARAHWREQVYAPWRRAA